MQKYIATAKMTFQNQTNAGILYLLPTSLIRFLYLFPLLLLWHSLFAGGADTGMALPQMLTYTYLGALLSDVLVVRTPASGWLYDGLISSLYQRPMTIFGHLAAQTLGEWIPGLLLFSLPMALLSPIFGVSLRPVSLWFFPSLLLCISLGFAVDFLFSCLNIHMKNANWLVQVIRTAIVSLFSGSVIPFAAFPAGIGKLLAFLPLGSLAAGPLSIFTELSDPAPILAAQALWNAVLWPAAFWTFHKSQEEMIVNGG